MGISLIDIVASNDFFCKSLGISVRDKANHQLSYRVYVLLAFLWLDLAFAVAVAFVPNENAELLLKLGDLPFHVMNRNRYFMTGVVIFYRLNPTVMLTFFVFGSFEWLLNSNRIYLQLNCALMTKSFQKLILRCKTALLVCTISMASIIVLAMVVSAINFRARNEQYNLIGAYIYIIVFAVLYTSLSCQFLVQLFLLCKICTEIFERINQGFYQDLILYKRHARFPSNLSRFSQMCYMVHNINGYIRHNYVTYFVCSLPAIVSLFYITFFSDLQVMSQALFLSTLGEVEPAIRLVFFLLMCYLAWLLVFLSNLIGQIDKSSRSLSDLIYESFVIKARCYSSQYIVERLIKYFQHVWGSTASVDILGQKVNSETSIRILTAFLTILAFMIGNLKG
ncbi:hypothetical protein TYRP_010886 [Tyrophagus putrescentiae]|nr:hypothetical protein TYRP_010886 [Tyrophagus putrescentiae]